jgi:hypothetical protein
MAHIYKYGITAKCFLMGRTSLRALGLPRTYSDSRTGKRMVFGSLCDTKIISAVPLALLSYRSWNRAPFLPYFKWKYFLVIKHFNMTGKKSSLN